jgi:hypothetical protein
MNDSSNGPQVPDGGADRMETMRRAGLTLDEIARVYGITGGEVYAVLRTRMPAEELGAPSGPAPAEGTPARETTQAAEPAPASVPQYAPVPAPATPRRRRGGRVIGWTLATLVLAAAAAVAVVATSSHGGKTPGASGASHPARTVTDPNGQVCAATTADGYCPGDGSAPAPTLPPSTPTTVTFNVTGNGDGGGAQITYGNNTDNISPSQCTGGDLGESCTVPWSATLPFDGTAEYWDLNAQLGSEGGSITCTIVVSGPGDQPLTVATGQASGAYQICDAQAAPTSSSGLSWNQE